MYAAINKSRANGSVIAPPSKSMTHRFLICAALSGSKSTIKNVAFSDDIIATIDCLKALGANFQILDDFVTVKGVTTENFNKNFNASANESGSTLRFMIPILLLTNNISIIKRSTSLASRPLDIFIEICNKQNLYFNDINNDVQLKGCLVFDNFKFSGNISSQFISGLLFALPLLKGDSTITLTDGIESRSYIDMTILALKNFGVDVIWSSDNTLYIKGNQTYLGGNFVVEGDYSNSAFYGALNALGSSIEIKGLNPYSLQGDKIFAELIDKIILGTPEIDISNCPDLAPILMTLASCFNGAHFTNTKRLKIKESDRGNMMAQELKKFGANITIMENDILVSKSILHTSGEVLLGHNDHRIVMSLAVICSLYSGVISGAEAVKKSFPDFFDKISGLGIEVKLND